MINEEILGGLKSALERGESLKRAMMTFYNSKYKKEEIEECARMLIPQEEMPNPPIQPVQETKPHFQQSISPIQKRNFPIQETGLRLQQSVSLQKPASQIQKTSLPIQVAKSYSTYIPLQKISDYGGEITSREKAIIIILIFLLIFLMGILGLIFLFKQEIINFFGNFFG